MGKPFITVLTDKRLLASVRALMHQEGSRLGKPLITDLTDERLLASIRALMPFEISG
jgi:hypothetical protein